MDSDGQNQIRLTVNDIIDHSPQFTADGLKIVYYSTNPKAQDYNIYIMDTDGSNKKCLTENKYYDLPSVPRDGSISVFDFMPCISADGSKMVFSEFDFSMNNYIICIMNSDGTDHRLVTNELGYNMSPVFTPDNSKIIFKSHRGGNHDLYEMSLDGKDQKNLTNDSGHAYFFGFSNDESKILFNSDRQTYYKIWIMDRDGSNQIQLTTGNYHDYYPRFQPTIGKNSR